MLKRVPWLHVITEARAHYCKEALSLYVCTRHDPFHFYHWSHANYISSTCELMEFSCAVFRIKYRKLFFLYEIRKDGNLVVLINRYAAGREIVRSNE